MKKIYITLGLLVALTSYSQNKQTEKADNMFASYQYIQAIKEYESLVKNKKADSYVYKQLANSYYQIFDMDKAVQYYGQAVSGNKTQDGEVYFDYAQALKTQGKYAEANKQMDKFSSLLPNDPRAKAHKLNPNYLPALQSKEKLFDIKETNLGKSGSSSFGGVLTNDNIVYFTSNRNGRKDKRGTGETFLDVFQSIYNADGTLSVPTSVSELNSKFQDGPVTVSADGTVMFFSRDGHTEKEFSKDKKANIKIGKVGIYRAEKKGGKWTNIKPVSFNSTAYNVGNPSLSKDGKTLYFASDMPGGLGDTDIWKVSVNGTEYGTPENLGSKVNTSGRENFPFIDEDGTLYFASSGRPGFGGLDVFRFDVNSSEAINVGQPVNSEKDDFAFTFNQTKEVGLFSSNRNGEDNIYYAYPVCGSDAIVTVKDSKTGKVLHGASVSILDGKNNKIKSETTDIKGTTNFYTQCDTEYSLQALFKDYEASTVVLPGTKEKRTYTEILLTPIDVVITDTEVILNSIFFEFDKSNITEQGSRELDKLVKVMNDYPSMELLVKSHTDSQGSVQYNQNLSNQRAQSTVQYLVSKGINKNRLSGKGFGKSEPKVNCENCTEEQDAQNRRSEFIIVKK